MLRIKSKLKPVSGAIASAPLIDVVFLLLIFFVLNSSLVFQPGITMELPDAMNEEMLHAMIPAKKMVLVISGQRDAVTGDQLMFFNNRQINESEFERAFREEIRKKNKNGRQSRKYRNVSQHSFFSLIICIGEYRAVIEP